MQLTIQNVSQALLRLLNHYPEAGHNGTTIGYLAQDYHEDLMDEHVSPVQFEAAIKTVRRRCKYFPKMSDILEAVREYRANPPASDSLQIEDSSSYHDPTPEERKQFKDRINAINDMIHEGTPMEETLKIVSQKIESFGEG